MQQACHHAIQMLNEYVPVEMICERYLEREPHPEGQEAFIIRTRFPWHRNPQTRIMIEITMKEKIINPIQYLSIIHSYEEPLEAKIPVYSLEEIIAEKLRAILQHAEKLKTRGWSRSRARDYYDLWRILNTYKKELNYTNFRKLLYKKCENKNVIFATVDNFFEKNMLEYIQETWEQWLAPLVPDLPPSEKIMEELRPQLELLLSEY
jgi:hypothetical protein